MKFNVPKILTEQAREFRKKPTLAEEKLWKELKGRRLAGYKFRRQQPIERVITDFACLEVKLVVEVDGEIHRSQKEYDKARDEFLDVLGFMTIRFSNNEVLNDMKSVKGSILQECMNRKSASENS